MSVFEHTRDVTVYGVDNKHSASMGMNAFGAAQVRVSASEHGASMETIGGDGEITVNGKTGEARIGVYDLGGQFYNGEQIKGSITIAGLMSSAMIMTLGSENNDAAKAAGLVM